MKQVMLSLAAGVLFTAYAAANEPARVENFTLKDYNGVARSLTDFRQSKFIVLLFVSTECPVSNAYNGRMAALEAEYGSRGIAFVGINSNKQESADDIRSHAAEHKLVFPILKDVDNVVADKVSASVTPEVYVLNPSLEILYHGRIDDARNERKVASKDLGRALDELLAGKTVSVPSTKAFGCTIKRIGS